MKNRLPFLLLAILLANTRAGAENRTDALYLTVRDCIAMALDNNLEISIQRIAPQMDAAALRQAKGDFDPALVLAPNYEENTTPLDAQSVVAAGGRLSTKSRTSSLSTSLQGKIPSGTSYDFGLRTSDGQNTFNSFQDQYSTFWGLSVTQPLLKGFGTANQLATIRIARKQKEISDEAFALKVMDIVTRIKTSYYNLVFAIENRHVQLQALDLASKLLDDNRKRVRIGVMAPLELTQAESGVAAREEDVILAGQEVNLRMNEIRALISQNVSELRDRPVMPTGMPQDASLPLMNHDEAITTAMASRPEYRQAQLTIEQRHLQVKYDENQRYPQMDLKSTYGYNGIGKDFSSSINADTERWSVGVAVRIPLPDQAGQGRLEKSLLDKERALLQLKQVEQNILVEVENALNNVEASYKRILATRASTHTSEQALDAENTRLKAGATTSFVVLELQKKLADARSRELRALADYHIALAQLHKAQGTSLGENDIELVK